MTVFERIPHFTSIQINDTEKQLELRLQNNRQQIQQLLQQSSFSWDNLVVPLMEIDNELDIFWSPIAHLHAVSDNPQLRALYERGINQITEYQTQVWQDENLFAAFTQIQSASNIEKLSFAQKKVISNAIRDFKLSGVHLDKEKKQTYMAIQKALCELQTRFGNNLLDARQAWHKHIHLLSRLSGLPEHTIAAAKKLAQEKNQEGYILTLDYPCYHAVMAYADDAELRAEIYKAYSTCASDQDQHNPKWDNSTVMEEILRLRHALAVLLGFQNYAELSLATKMARSTQQVMEFLMDLATRTQAIAQLEYNYLKEFALISANAVHLNAWDIPYYSEKLRQRDYALSQEDLRPYFPINKVLSGLFHITQQLFEVTICEIPTTDKWHPDVRCFHIIDQGQNIRGRFYIDLFARENKRDGAWMDDYCSRFRTKEDKIQVPVAFLCCNFSAPTGNKPALLTHDEVQTLFHEFGHGIHHMLTLIDCLPVAGINGVAWDAVELPSQFMENFCWEREVLNLITEHYQTGDTLPDPLYEKIKNAKNFQSAMQMARQLEFSLFDFRIHLEYDPAAGTRIQKILDETRQLTSVVPVPDFNRFQHGFSHIFAGGYAAGYYSYKWAEVLSSDAYDRFEKEGIFNKETGQAFLHTILEMGGAKDAMELFIEFRGRKPSVDAFLRHNGFVTNTP